MAGPSDVPPVVRFAEPNARGESDDRYRHFLALSGHGIARFMLDHAVDVGAPEGEQVALIARHGRIAECNEVFARLYDRDAAAMTGLTLAEFVPADDPARFEGIRQFVRSGYRLVDGEEIHRLPDGSSRWVAGSALGVVQGGRLLSYWLTLADVTERKRAEEDRERRGRILEAVAFGAARLLEPGRWLAHVDLALERLGRAVGVSRIGITRNEVDPEGAFRGVLHAEWTAPGVPPRAKEKSAQEGVHGQDVGWEHWQDEMRRGQPLVAVVSQLSEEEQALFKVLGTKSFAAVPILTNGQWWGVLGIHETGFGRQWSGPEIEALKAAASVLAAAIEREHAEEAIRESEERFERLAAAAFEGIAITEGGVFIDANEQLAGLLGYDVAELVGREVAGFVADEDRERVSVSLRTASEEAYQHQARRRDGSVFPVEVRARALPHRGRTVRVSAIRDVSARASAEDRQRRLEGELRDARAMEAMGALVAGVAHEVRNPLFSISATVDALESELGTRPEFPECAALLRSQVDRLNRLMRDLLDYGKPSTLRRGPARLQDLVRRAVRSCGTLAREREVRVAEELAEDLPALDLDAARVEQALENLVANAIQHAPRGSVVRIVGRLDTAGPWPCVRCAVEDEGPGLPGEDLTRAFEPFFSRRKGGTGLGLPIVQRVAKAHGGDVIAENRPGAGARFTLLLPLGGAREALGG